MLKVGIIGCGKVADQHAEEIRRIPGCEIAGVCDSEELMAKQMQERFGIMHCFDNPRELLSKARPDIVHITTPPESHFALGKLCLEAGCSVYLEKPFTLYAEEAEDLVSLADQHRVKLTAGHNYQFSHVALEARKLISQGFLGGPPVHMESYYCYNFGDPSYARALLGDKNHWVRRLPGKLLHNIISHGISRIAEFLTGDRPAVISEGHTSPLLKKIGEHEMVDEVRVIIKEEDRATAYFTFSSQIRPVLQQFRIYGMKNSLIIDENNQTLIKVRGDKYKSYLDHFIPPLEYGKQYLSNSMRNIRKFIKSDFHMNSGMAFLIRSFYRSVTADAPLPIPYREIVLTARIMDDIFQQVNRQQ